MNFPGLQHAGPLAINMNQPGSFPALVDLHVSVANLVLIAVMVVIFGAALLLPFPRGVREEPAARRRRRRGRRCGAAAGRPRTMAPPACGRPGCGAAR